MDSRIIVTRPDVIPLCIAHHVRMVADAAEETSDLALQSNSYHCISAECNLNWERRLGYFKTVTTKQTFQFDIEGKRCPTPGHFFLYLADLRDSQILTLKKWITSYPELFGACIGLVIVVAIIAMVKWAPWIGDAWDTHNTLVRDVWCSVGLFVACLVQFWPLRRRAAFWVSIVILFLLHSLGIFSYSFYVHSIALSQWMVLMLVEGFVFFLVIPWLTHLFTHYARRSRSIGH
jgi:hypothetical protein